jgi:V/A-type H+-transporting ATPase subunit C
MNARIRAMKSRLLAHTVLENLILKPDLDSMIAELERTPYREEIEKASVQYSGILCVEVALRKDFTNAFRKILGFAQGEKSEIYIRILLTRWDVQNLKTILRGKNIHVPSPEIMECLVPAGELDEATLIELVKQPDVKAVIDLLAMWEIDYAGPLIRSFKEYLENHDLAVLEYAIDRFYYEHALELVKGVSYNDQIIRQMIAIEIDVTNIKSVLKMIRDKAPVKEVGDYLIEGGIALDIDKLLSLAKAGSVRAAIQLLQGTPYEFLTKTPEEVFIQEKISVIEKELDKYLIRKGESMFLRDPLSIAITVGYLWAKYNEVTNIRIIARCKTVEILEKELREELVYV